jgi:hypothetical protein
MMMLEAEHVIVVITESGFSIEALDDIDETAVIAAYHVVKQGMPDARIALYKRIRPDDS